METGGCQKRLHGCHDCLAYLFPCHYVAHRLSLTVPCTPTSLGIDLLYTTCEVPCEDLLAPYCGNGIGFNEQRGIVERF